MKKTSLTILIIFLFFSVQKINASNIEVTDTIATSTTWSVDTVKVTGDLTILDEVVLTINPGTIVELYGHYSIFLEGCIKAIGTVGDTIVFTAANKSEGWAGIRIDNGPLGTNGAMDDNDSTKLVYCKFEYGRADNGDGDDNDKEDKGGAISCGSFNKLVIRHSAFTNNYAKGYGGALMLGSMNDIVIDRCYFANDSSSESSGGAIAIFYYTFKITNCTIENCYAGSRGGAIYIFECEGGLIKNNIIRNNFSDESFGGGGGILFSNSTSADIIGNTFYNNITDYQGGGLKLELEYALVSKNIFSNNQSRVHGAGLIAGVDTISITNNLFCNNGTILNNGGGLYVISNKTVLINNTICNNYSLSTGGGMYITTNSGIMVNNIIWGNTASSGNNNIEGTITAANCLIEGGYTGTNILDANPNLTAPSAGSGISFDGLSADWSLTDSSVCINAGTPDTTGLNLPLLDLAGEQRVINDTIDIGAYETYVDINITPSIDDQIFSIDENSTNGSIVDTVDASDNNDGQTLTYSIISGNTNDAFAIISSSGIITINDSTFVNHELIDTFNLEIKVTDNGIPSLSDSAIVKVAINDINEVPIIESQGFNIDENTLNGEMLDTVNISDEDTGQTHTFSIISGNTDNTFEINSSTGILSVANTDGLNHEVNGTFNLEIQVTDNGTSNLSSSNTVIITVNDINESPVIDDQQFSIDENVESLTTIGTIIADDEDESQLLTFSVLTGNLNNAFSVDSNSGIITVNNALEIDYEINASFSLVVKVEDDGSGNLSDTATININLNDLIETGLLSDKAINNINIFPNPANNVLNIEFESEILDGTSIELRDVNSRIIYNNLLNQINTSEIIIIDISEFNNSIYYLLIKNKESVFTKKILVNR